MLAGGMDGWYHRTPTLPYPLPGRLLPMTSARTITELLLRWDSLREQGQDITPEELCREHPELLPEVRRRLEALRAMYQALGDGNAEAAAQETISLKPVTVLPASTPSAPVPETPSAMPPGYELLGVLGRGGMGVVYKAKHLRLNRVVALKMILAGSHADEAELMRFLREAEAVAALQHPGIVQIFEMGVHNGLPYLALEFVEGGSLDKKFNKVPHVPRQSAQVVETLARAMQAAHRWASSTAT
jgi:serine/threonine-protein kinase